LGSGFREAGVVGVEALLKVLRFWEAGVWGELWDEGIMDASLNPGAANATCNADTNVRYAPAT
jgi:hypothetical protein